MKKINCTGWRKVFSFTLQQNLKSTSSIVFLTIFFVVGLLSMPLLEKLVPVDEAALNMDLAAATSSVSADLLTETDSESSPIKTVYFVNKTSFPLENLDEFIGLNPAFSKTEVENGDLDYESWEAEQPQGLGGYSLYVSLKLDESGFHLNCEAPLKSYLDTEDLTLFEYSFTQYLDLKKLEWSGLSATQIDALRTQVSGSVSQLDEDGNPVSGLDFNNSEYWTSYSLIIIIIFIIAISAEGIAVSVLTEKSSKIVEYLMMSIKPMALIVGKTLAMLCSVLIQFGALIAGMLLSCFLNGFLQEQTLAFVPAASLKQFLSLDIFKTVNPFVILIMFLIVGAGLIFYCTLAGVAGASVSRMEEIGEALKLYNIIMVIGAYFGLGIAISSSAGGISVINYIAYLLPLSSPFIVPVHLVLGKIPVYVALISLGILILFIVLALYAASRIYTNMLFYNGKPMKLKDMIQFIKNSGKEAE